VKLCPRLPPKKRSNGGARARELGDRARFAAALARKKTGQNIRFCMARQSAPAGILRGRNNTKNPERYPIRVERFRPRFSFRERKRSSPRFRIGAFACSALFRDEPKFTARSFSLARALFETRASDDILTLERQPHTVLDRALVASKSALLAVSLRVAVSARRRLRKERS
jgi:hypothetical protein